MKQLTFAVLVIFSAISCKKETPQYSATGLWLGNIYVVNCGILNRPDGTCRYYEEVGVTDTSIAKLKREGTYTVTGNRFRAEFEEPNFTTMVVEGDFIAPDKMVGRVINAAYNFEMNMRKQQ